MELLATLEGQALAQKVARLRQFIELLYTPRGGV
jgi:hypothetical protein